MIRYETMWWDKNIEAIDDTVQQILQYAQTHGEITRADVEQLLGISAASASRRIRNLVTSKQLRQIGKARNIRYTVYDV